MDVIDLTAAYDRYGLQRRLEEGLTFSRSLCTDALEIIHKPVDNWNTGELMGLVQRLDEQVFDVYRYTETLIRAIDSEREGDE